MTREELNAIDARAAAATTGPWHCREEYVRAEPARHLAAMTIGANQHDSAFIAHARTDVPALVAEVRRLRAELAYIASGDLAPTQQSAFYWRDAVDYQCDVARSALVNGPAMRSRYGTRAPYETGTQEANRLRAALESLLGLAQLARWREKAPPGYTAGACVACNEPRVCPHRPECLVEATIKLAKECLAEPEKPWGGS